jgi:hypothetical protein
MSTISHPPVGAAQEQGWASLLRLKEIWASFAITAIGGSRAGEQEVCRSKERE